MSTDLVIQGNELAPSTLFGTDNPAEVVERAATVAKTLADLVRKQNLIVRIGQSDHVRVEGWTLLGSMLGVFPVVTWTHPVIENEATVGWEARVEARTRGGEIVGAAEAECLRSERTWKGRDDYALRSMAQTRAVSKALRLPLGFVMQLAGFDPTPADEMPVIDAPYVDPAAGTPFSYDYDERLVPPADTMPAAASPSSPVAAGSPEVLEVVAIVARLLTYAEETGKRGEMQDRINTDAEKKTPAAHLAWLRAQAKRLDEKLAAGAAA